MAKLRELAPAARGRQEAGITQPSLHLFLHIWNKFVLNIQDLRFFLYLFLSVCPLKIAAAAATATLLLH